MAQQTHHHSCEVKYFAYDKKQPAEWYDKMVFLKKEITEYSRNGKLIVFGIIAFVFGLMNPAITKLTPWLFETMADSLKEQGMRVINVETNAASCWQQYYKNLPMLLIIFLILSAGSFAKEYGKGTLLLVITKGYPRKKIFLAKTVMILGCYTAVSLVYFGVTYFYSGYYWDNSILSHIGLAALFYWVFGLLAISLILFFSSIITDTTGIIGATAGSMIALYLLSIIPKAGKYLPVKLMSSEQLLSKAAVPGDFTPALIITLVLAAGFAVAGGAIFSCSRTNIQ